MVLWDHTRQAWALCPPFEVGGRPMKVSATGDADLRRLLGSHRLKCKGVLLNGAGQLLCSCSIITHAQEQPGNCWRVRNMVMPF